MSFLASCYRRSIQSDKSHTEVEAWQDPSCLAAMNYSLVDVLLQSLQSLSPEVLLKDTFVSSAQDQETFEKVEKVKVLCSLASDCSLMGCII